MMTTVRTMINDPVMDSSRHDGTDSPDDAGDVVVTLNSFQSKIIKVRVGPAPCLTHDTERGVRFIFWFIYHPF